MKYEETGKNTYPLHNNTNPNIQKTSIVHGETQADRWNYSKKTQ